jgi:hypothetical protein
MVLTDSECICSTCTTSCVSSGLQTTVVHAPTVEAVLYVDWVVQLNAQTLYD